MVRIQNPRQVRASESYRRGQALLSSAQQLRDLQTGSFPLDQLPHACRKVQLHNESASLPNAARNSSG